MALSPPTAPTAPDLNSPATYNARVLSGFEYCFTTLPDWVAGLDASDWFSVQSGANDITAGVIALMGNDADYRNLSADTFSTPSATNAIDFMDQNVSWTPTLYSSGGGETISLSTAAGGYFRYGDLCICNGRIVVDSVSGGSGVARIGGLPFTVKNVSVNTGSIQLSMASGFYSNVPTTGITLQNTVTIGLYRPSGGALVTLDWSEVQAGTEMRFTIIYQVE